MTTNNLLAWLNRNAAAVQAVGSIATVIVTLILAWITRKYVQLTQDLAVAAREQLRFQQQTERSGAAQLLTLTQVFLTNLRRMPMAATEVHRIRDLAGWKHSDVTMFSSLAANVLGAAAPVHDAVQGLLWIGAKVDAVRQRGERAEALDDVLSDRWRKQVEQTRAALLAVREAAEVAEAAWNNPTDPSPAEPSNGPTPLGLTRRAS